MTTIAAKRLKLEIAAAKKGKGRQAHDNAEKPTGQEGETHYQAFRFSFGEAHVRAATDQDKPIFMNADLGRALGLSSFKGSYAHHLRKLDSDQKILVNRSVFDLGTPTLNVGVTPDPSNRPAKAQCEAESGDPDEGSSVWAVTESGLYTLIMRCRGATTKGTTANRFLRWVTDEVLPAIRKTGSFTNASQPESQDTITIDLREEARWVVINFPGKKPIIRRTPVDGLLDEWSALDTQILAAQIQTVHALWQKAEMIRSFGDDPAGSRMYDHLSTAISDAARLAREYRLAIITRPE